MADAAPNRGAPPENAAGYFDARAATWDESPVRRALTAALAREIPELVTLHRGLRVIEYGCGTAALSTLLAGTVGDIVAADASAGMLDQVRRKLAAYPLPNLTPKLLDLTRDPLPPERFGLVVLAMALHHVEDAEALLGRLATLLSPGGTLVVADLVAEDGTFHTDIAVPHHGFAPDDLARHLEQLGLCDCRWHIAHRIDRDGREYPVFILAATRPADTAGGR